MALPYVFSFGAHASEGTELIGDGSERRRVLGGKGAGLAEMSAAGLPVPPGFTISCLTSLQFLQTGQLPIGAGDQISTALSLLERRMGRRLGDAESPLLVSVRSGSPKSMPGMMDTILNLGLNDKSVEGLARQTRNRRFAYDAYRRFISGFATLVFGARREDFEHLLTDARKAARVRFDHELSEDVVVSQIVPRSLALARAAAERDFPQDPLEQLRLARETVFRSWNNARAIEYRRRFHISDELGTAVNVQAMVFGNKGDRSATGVGFTRNPATGQAEFFGEFLTNAQGEDVVAGIRTPQPIAELEATLPEAFKALREHTDRLERLYKWPQDFEFTIEDGTLYLLQTRDAKCTARAALRWAIDLVDAGIHDDATALTRIDAQSLDQLLHPVFDPKAKRRASAVTVGLAAGPGAASGVAVFSAVEAVARARAGKSVVLIRPETSADDIAGMIAAVGVLTATGGMTSHAAVVGRQLGKPCVVGASELNVDARARSLTVGGRVLREGDAISLDGTTGEVFFEAIPTVPSEILQYARGDAKEPRSELFTDYFRLMSMADRASRLKVRTNADRPKDAHVASRLGARGIGLCRTEHMFFEATRLPIVRRMILAAPRARLGLQQLEAAGLSVTLVRKQLRWTGDRRATRVVLERIQAEFGEAIEAYLQALAALLPLQRADFLGLFREMAGHPVTIRTLDPPLHEFLPSREQLMVAAELLRHGRTPEGWKGLEHQLRPLVTMAKGTRPPSRLQLVELVLHQVEELHEQNPMLGHRGCRLGITYPEVTAMQARAIFEAAAECTRTGVKAQPEVMIPLVGTVEEIRRQKAIVLGVLNQVESERDVEIETKVGTMIEVPRAALTADEIATEAEFFSFGTNDLTQMTFGFSRDDAGRFIRQYVDEQILPRDPFVSIDERGVGQLIEMAVNGGRRARPDLHVGICGEHGGDPDSVALCHRLGLDYVSCSPMRVPIARLAAAQAAVRYPAAAQTGADAEKTRALPTLDPALPATA
jgi:pyruvate,orthophosphate dikinase